MLSIADFYAFLYALALLCNPFSKQVWHPPIQLTKILPIEIGFNIQQVISTDFILFSSDLSTIRTINSFTVYDANT